MVALLGDEVRVKAGEHRGRRGVVTHVANSRLRLRLDDSDAVADVTADDVTNYSLAARKAWKSMPDRAVGRPKGLKLCDRVSVTLRIDRDLWQRFQQCEDDGRITDRTGLINECLRRTLDAVERLDAGREA